MPWIKQYTDEQEDFLRQYPLLCRKELAEKFNARFGTSKSVEAIRNHCRRRLGMRMPRLTTFGGDCVPWNKGMKGWHAKGAEKGWFKKGNVMNKYDVGTEHKKAGITHVKYTDEHKESRKNFAPKHHVVWEKHNGKRPPSHVVVFKDGNKDNCVIENLELIPRGLFMTLTKIGWSNEPQELKPTIKAMVELQAEMKKAMDKKFAT
jgi:hypothetical protein